MELKFLDQVTGQPWRENLDLVVAASGYERRATHVAMSLDVGEHAAKIAIGFEDRRALAREENDRLFTDLGYEILSIQGQWLDRIRGHIVQGSRPDGCFRLAIDYSSMTRNIYARILRLLADTEVAGRVECYLSYTPSHYSEPLMPRGGLHASPIEGFSRLDLPQKPTALIVGLGYEERKALGLVDHVEAAESYAFLADPAIDDRFVEVVERNNADLLRRLGTKRVFRYPLADLRATAAILSSVAFGLEDDYRVILAPLGPKPFTLICLLLAFRYPQFDVWRVSSRERGNVYDRQAYGEPLVVRALFG